MEDQYQALYSTFRWWVPQRLNIADVCCRRWTDSGTDARRIAIYSENALGQREVWTFARLNEYASRLANGLRRMGVKRGDRVAIVLPQRPEMVVALLAALQLGAIAVPLSTRLNAATYEQRLRDSEARLAIVDGAAAGALLPAAVHCPLLRQTLALDLDDDERVLPWRTLLARQDSAVDILPMLPSDPALLLYTSGPGGMPKGVVLPHSAVIGDLPGFVAAQNWFPRPGDVLWTASEWCSPHGLFSALLPALYFGQPLVGTRADLAPAAAFDLMERYGVTNLALTTRQLRQLLKADPRPIERFDLAVRAISTTDSALGVTLFAQCKAGFGVEPNETFSQVEVGTVIGQCGTRWPIRPGSMGRPYPGHQVAVIDGEGKPVGPGISGEIAVNRHDIHGHADPSFLTRYWRGEETGRPVSSVWQRTGDLARVDADGYFWYAGRIEDMFHVGDRLVAPGAIEDELVLCPGVAEVVATPAMDGAGIKAYVVPESDKAAMDKADQDAALRASLLEYARARLDPALAPLEIEFVEAVPLTPSGKILRQALRQIEDDRGRKWPPVAATAAPLP